MYETFCTVCKDLAKSKKARGEEANIYLYIGKNHLAIADRGVKHLEDAVRGMEGRFDGSHMARHTLEMHPGEQPKFGMTIVRTYTSAFTLAMGEVIRILYRSREENVVLLNSKAGDFASYSLPRLSVSNLGEEQEALSHRNGPKTCHQNESRNGKSSDLSRNFKNIYKTPCLNVKRKTRPANKKILRSNGT